MFLIYLAVFILILSTVIGIHELGHFLFARKFKMHCYEFSIGMGPTLFSKDGKQTRFAIKLLPIGGSVEISGEQSEELYFEKGQKLGLILEGSLVKEVILSDNYDKSFTTVKISDYNFTCKDRWLSVITEEYIDDSNEKLIFEKKYFLTDEAHLIVDDLRVFGENRTKKRNIVEKGDRYDSKPVYQRFLTIFAGALFNFLLALALFFMINLITGSPTKDNIIDYPLENTPAEEIGLLKSDEIISLNGVSISTWEDISTFMDNYECDEVIVEYKRDNVIYSDDLLPIYNNYTLGISSNQETSTSTIIGEIYKGYPAYDAGLRENDGILSIKTGDSYEVEVNNWYEVNDILKTNISNSEANLKIEKVTIKILRDGEMKTFTMTPLKTLDIKDTYSFSIGISPLKEFKPHIAFIKSFKDIFGVISLVGTSIYLIVFNSDVGFSDLSGIVGIYSTTKTFINAGIINLLFWIAFLSVNLGVMNLLPFPPLDGGKLLFLGYEGITKKKIKPKIENIVSFIGVFLLLILFIFVTINDVFRIFN